MTSDDQHFLDLLSSISHDVKRHSVEIANAVDRGTERAALFMRETLHSATWLPESARPASRKLPPSRVPIHAALPWSYFRYARNWVYEHRAFTAALLAFVGTGGFLLFHRRSYVRKRRARRTSKGEKMEVVVVAGNANSPITRSIITDLERRGFIVYVVVGSEMEGQMIQGESKRDIFPLQMDITNPLEVQSTIESFNQLLGTTQVKHASVELNFTGIVVVPDITYPAGSVETISSEMWSDALNTEVLGTIIIAQAFLRSLIKFNARFLILTPTIIPSLKPPCHGVESVVASALEGFTSSLRGELKMAGVSTCHLKLGLFDYGSFDGRQQLQRIGRGTVLTWPPADTHARDGRNFLAQGPRGDDLGMQMDILGRTTRGGRGSPLRELNNAVFDALTQQRPWNTWRVGRGSLLYELFGTFVPSGIIGLMMGVTQVPLKQKAKKVVSDSG